jgi:hypothetical protein
MLRYASFVLLAWLTANGALAEQSIKSLDRPDPGIGAGFATRMEGQFKTAYGVNDTEAKCLVFEVMTYIRKEKAYGLTPVQVAEIVAPNCGGLRLGDRRGQ